MSATVAPQPVPLRRDESGVLRVGQSRVPLERILEAYLDGASPETIVQWFESLRLADVYAVISYYLNHEADVSTYLSERNELAEEVRRKIEANQPSRPTFREELMARRARAMVM